MEQRITIIYPHSHTHQGKSRLMCSQEGRYCQLCECGVIFFSAARLCFRVNVPKKRREKEDEKNDTSTEQVQRNQMKSLLNEEKKKMSLWLIHLY